MCLGFLLIFGQHGEEAAGAGGKAVALLLSDLLQDAATLADQIIPLSRGIGLVGGQGDVGLGFQAANKRRKTANINAQQEGMSAGFQA